MSERYTVEYGEDARLVMIVNHGNKDAYTVFQACRELNRLADEGETLRAVIQETLDHVEDMNLERLGTNQCTLCATYRKKMRAALNPSGETP